MPRTARASLGGYRYHVINRGNTRAEVFHKPSDYQPFLALAAVAVVRLPMRLVAFCLMPNYLHLVLWPREDGDLSRWMHRQTTSNVRRYHTRGHVWQGDSRHSRYRRTSTS